MLNILAIMAGGSIGALCRHGLFVLIQRFSGPVFPAGTLAVNLLGSFLIGFIWCLFDETHWSHEWRLFVFTGLLGGFTTFSTFSLETLNLVRDNEIKLAALNILANNIIGIVFVFGGFFLTRFFMNAFK